MNSLSITARVTLDMHALNNEGTEGNQLLTRMVHIVDQDGQLQSVNAVSGDMLKHVLAEHFQRLAEDAGLPLCGGCTRVDPNRINWEINKKTELGKSIGKDNEPGIDRALRACSLCDAAGFLITEGGASIPRKSCVEFGWLVGLPDRTRTESYFHVKYDPTRGATGDSAAAEGANVGQAIFHRPASSGVYALVANVELSRVGFNDVSRVQMLGDDDARQRRNVLLQAVLSTVIQPRGAHRNTQNPHVLATEGVAAWSDGALPAPTASALVDGYREQVEQTAAELNRFGRGRIETRRFDDQAAFAALVADLVGAPAAT